MARPGVRRRFLEEVISKQNLDMKKKSFQKNRKKCYKQKDRTKDVILVQQKEKVFCHRALWLILNVTSIGSQSMTHWTQQNAKHLVRDQ